MMNITGLHIEPTNICTLKCPGCARTQFIDQWPHRWQNHSLDIDQLMNFIDVDITGVDVHLCGNYGDPIYHPGFLDMVIALKARGANIVLTTNGSYKKVEWWQNLCQVLNDTDTVVFSIDGIENNFTQYRINGDWDSILGGIKTCVQYNVKTVWKFIPFAFNTDSLEQAKQLSENLGMSEFYIEYSDRFDNNTLSFIPVEGLLHPRKPKQDLIKQGQAQLVNPKCQQGHTHFITATGHYVPCCFVADHRFYYKTIFGKNQSLFSIVDKTLSTILDQQNVVEFYSSINTEPPLVCQYNCPVVG